MSVQWCNWTLSDTNKIYYSTEALLVAESVQLRHWTLSMQSRRSAIRLTVSSCLTKGSSRSVPQQVVPLNLNGQKFSFRKISVHLWLCQFLYHICNLKSLFSKFLLFHSQSQYLWIYLYLESQNYHSKILKFPLCSVKAST
jgi:hypothetical protein